MVGKPVSRPRSDGQPGRTWDRQDPFPCYDMCASAGELVPEVQASRRCTLPSFRGAWTDEPSERVRLKLWVGMPPEHESHNYRPHEDLDDGCPGGWARSRFAMSLHPYMRGRLQGGGHDTNPRVDSSTPGHILDALSYYEREYARADSEFMQEVRGG